MQRSWDSGTQGTRFPQVVEHNIRTCEVSDLSTTPSSCLSQRNLVTFTSCCLIISEHQPDLQDLPTNKREMSLTGSYTPQTTRRRILTYVAFSFPIHSVNCEETNSWENRSQASWPQGTLAGSNTVPYCFWL